MDIHSFLQKVQDYISETFKNEGYSHYLTNHEVPNKKRETRNGSWIYIVGIKQNQESVFYYQNKSTKKLTIGCGSKTKDIIIYDDDIKNDLSNDLKNRINIILKEFYKELCYFDNMQMNISILKI